MREELSVVFRVDASRKIGIGHFMRCLTLADALKKNRVHTRFICRHLPESLHGLLSPNNHELVLLNNSDKAGQLDELANARLLETSQKRDAIDTLNALDDRKWDWLIIDHYAIDVRYESDLRKSVNKIMVIDDIADRVHDCDILLDQNLYSNMDVRYEGKVPSGCQLLLGPDYALLRDEFRRLRATLKPRIGPIKRILVFFGGVDPENLTGRSLDAINNIEIKEISVDVVIGAENPHRSHIEEICNTRHYSCHIQTTRMAELMAASDLALGAGGSTSWERCCLGLTTACISFADNQFDIANALHKADACEFIGNHITATQKSIEKTLIELIKDTSRFSSISMNAFSLVDGNGIDRVCAAINQYYEDHHSLH